MAATRSSPVLAPLLVVLAAFSAILVDAARLDGSSMGEAEGKPSRSKASKIAPVQSETPKSQREAELRMAFDFVQAVQVKETLKLNTIKDVIDRIESIRQIVLRIGSSRDSNSRKLVRNLLRDCRSKIDALKPLVVKKEAAGEVDDGGEILPTNRKNICTYTTVDADEDFLKELDELCEALDAVRFSMATGVGEEAAVFAIVGRMSSIKTKGAYLVPRISWGINSVLNEEKRWVTRQLAQKAARGEPVEKIFKTLEMWNGAVFTVNPLNYAQSARERALREAYEVGMQTTVDQNTSLSALRTGWHRLNLYKNQLDALLLGSDLGFTDRVQGVLRMYNIKMALMETMSDKREKEGEVDDGGDVPPSQRESICSRIDDYQVKEEIKVQVKEICEKLDKMREVVLSGGDGDAALFEVVGRVNALKATPGYLDMPLACEVELVLGEEGRWVNNNWNSGADRPKELEPPSATAAPTAGAPSEASAEVVAPLRTQELVDAKELVQAMGLDNSFNLSAMQANFDRLDLLDERLLVKGTKSPRLHAQIRQLSKMIAEKREELMTLAGLLESEGAAPETVLSEHPPDTLCLGLDLDSYDLAPKAQADLEEICGELRRSRSTRFDDDVASRRWLRVIGDMARRVLALFTTSPRAVYDFLLMLTREKALSLRQLAQRRPAPRAPSGASGDGAEVAAQEHSISDDS